MKKWIIIGGAFVAAIIIFLVVVVSNIGPIIKKAVNTYGPGITKTAVRLGDVGVSLFTGEAKLKDFHLGNPKGFKSPEAMSVASIYVGLDKKTLTKDIIVIDKIEVIRPEITYEKQGGTDNFKAILDNVKKTTDKGEPATKQTEKESGGKKLIIKNFIVKDGKVNLVVPVLGGKTVSAPLPDIHLKDVGKEKSGATPSEAFKEIFSSMYEKITSSSVTNTLNEGLKSAGATVKDIGEGAKKGVGTTTDRLKGIFGK